MRRTRQALAATLAAIALIAVGCGGSDTPDKGAKGPDGSKLPACPVDAFKKASGRTEVVLWHSWVGRTAATIKAIADSYNASQDKVTVRVESQGANYDELRRNYEQAMGARKLPAIVAGEDTWTQFMADSGTAIPAESCIDADKDERAHIDDMLPAVTSGYSIDGVQWPAAFGVSTVVLYYNKDNFRAAGLDPDKPPETLSELRTVAEKLKAAGKGPAGPLVVKLDPWYVEHLTTGDHDTLVNHDNGRDGNRATKSTLDNPGIDASFEFLSSMRKDGLLNPVANSKLIDHYLAVATESSSMLFETSTAMTLIDGVVEGNLDLQKELGDAAGGINIPAGFKVPFEIGVAPYPGIKDPGRGQVGGGAIYVTSTGSDAVKSAAWDFIKYFNQVDNQVRWTREGSYLPVRESVQKKLDADPSWSSSRLGKWISIVFDGVKSMDAKFPGPLIGPYDEFRRDLGQAMEAVAIGGDAPSAALKTASKNIDAAIAKYNDTNF